jgi:membrane complex biogenesis BtpA family protein
MVQSLFASPKPIIGMLHLPPLPGSPRHSLALDEIREHVLRDASALVQGGVDGLMLENFGDTPFYPNRVPPHVVAMMAVLGREVTSRFSVPLGINVLRNDGLSALAVASACGARFIRVNVFTGARVADQGLLQGEAHEIMRYRKSMAADVAVFADVAVKHSAPLGERTLEDEVEDTVYRGGADAIIVSGSATGKAASLDDVRLAAKAASATPVFVGSGVTAANIREILSLATGVIVGTGIKEGGKVGNPVDPNRVAELIRAARG